MSDGVSLNQAEHDQISTSLEVEQIEASLFRSKSLWLPLHSRGVFGGQVISQAVVSATNCVDPAYGLHSLHCYFLTSASPATPIIYNVERVRTGKSYASRSVKAIQNGHIIFVMICSFQKPEPWQPSYQWKMPDVPPPDQCEDEEKVFIRIIENPKSSPEAVKIYKDFLSQRSKSPVAIKHAKIHHVDEKGIINYMYWMKARNIPDYETPFQKCILAYMSDLHFIGTAPRVLGLRRGGTGPQLGMNSTIDHAIWFYSNDFNAGDWILYEMNCPIVGSGRGVVHGRMYTQSGKLIAAMSQEGVVRAAIRGPETAQAAKL